MITIGNNFPVNMGNAGRGRPAAEVPTGNHFGAWLRKARHIRAMTGEALAFAIGGGMAQGRISAYERGIKKPERDTVVKIAQALGADPADALAALMRDTPGVEVNEEEETQIKEWAQRLARFSPEEQEDLMQYAQFLTSRRGQ